MNNSVRSNHRLIDTTGEGGGGILRIRSYWIVRRVADERLRVKRLSPI